MKSFIRVFSFFLSLIIMFICFSNINAQEVKKLKEIPFEHLNSFQYNLNDSETINKTIDELEKETSVKFNLNFNIPKGLLNHKINIKDKKHYLKIVEKITNNLNASFSLLNPYEFHFSKTPLPGGTFASEDFFIDYRYVPLTNDKNKILFNATLFADWRALRIIKASCCIIQKNETYNLNNDSSTKGGVVEFSSVLSNFDTNKEYKIKIEITAEKHTAVGLVFNPIEEKIFSGKSFSLKTGKISDKNEYPFLPVNISYTKLFSKDELDLLKNEKGTNIDKEKLDAIKARIPTIMGPYYFKNGLPVKRVESYAINPPMFRPIIEIQLPKDKINNRETMLGIVLFLKDEDKLVKTITIDSTTNPTP